jgi:hypothetical protein
MAAHLSKTVLVALALAACALVAQAETTCSDTVGAPGDETSATLSILSPDDGDVITTTGCGEVVEVLGRWTIEAPADDYDFYIVIDRSSSTNSNSGADVNGNGRLGEAADNILRAEIAAARAFVDAVDPNHARIAIISFSSTAQLQQQLGTVAQAQATLTAMATLTPSGGTRYVPAMALVEAEIGLRGSPATRRQHCLFLSDGRPGDSASAIDDAARRLGALGVVIDTFALGFDTSPQLLSMATITGGSFTALDVPGEIVDVLQLFVPVTPSQFVVLHVENGQVLPIEVRPDGTFSIMVPIVLGLNRIRLTLAIGDPPALTLTCGIDMTVVQVLVADAGPDLAGCAGRRLTLSGARSTVPCPGPLYRWLDCRGTPISAPSPNPRFTITCGACDRYVLETWCAGEGCPATDEVLVAVTRVPPPVPALVRTCGLEAFVTCGVELPGYETGWDLDPADDADGNGDPADDADLLGCEQSVVLPAPGSATISAWRRDASACSVAAGLVVSAGLQQPRPLDGGSCPGEELILRCATEPPGGRTEWDLDATSDADGDGDPGNDADALGCDVSTWPADGPHEIRAWSIDAFGCRSLAAAGTILVADGVPPGEAWGVRLAKRGADLEIAWQPVAAADRYAVARGTIRSLAIERAYDHVVDEPAGAGLCGLSASPGRDAGEIAEPGSFYYLVTAISDCAGEGHAGFAWTPWIEPRRPPRIPSASCP